MKKLEILVLNDNFDQEDLDTYSDNLEAEGVMCKLTYVPEKTLDEPGKIPQNSILNVHGNAGAFYENVGKVRRLAGQREDLRFVMDIDQEHFNLYNFCCDKDFNFAKDAYNVCANGIPSGRLPQVLVHVGHMYHFLSGRPVVAGDPPGNFSIKEYIPALKREIQP